MDVPPLLHPNCTTRRQVQLRARQSFEDPSKHRHTLEIPSYYQVRYNYIFSPTQMKDTPSTQT